MRVLPGDLGKRRVEIQETMQGTSGACQRLEHMFPELLSFISKLGGLLIQTSVKRSWLGACERTFWVSSISRIENALPLLEISALCPYVNIAGVNKASQSGGVLGCTNERTLARRRSLSLRQPNEIWELRPNFQGADCFPSTDCHPRHAADYGFLTSQSAVRRPVWNSSRCRRVRPSWRSHNPGAHDKVRTPLWYL